MEDFNIAEALKYAPKGLKLYSPVLGEVEISEVSQGTYAIEVKISDKHYSFTEHGRYLEGKGECLLFPSKDHRTWDNWQDILLPQSIGCVCVNTCTPEPTMFICAPNGTVFDDNTGSTWDSLMDMGGSYLKSSRYASPEEVQQFFINLKAKGYEWNGENVVKTTPASPFKVGDWVVKKDGSRFFDGSRCAKITNITSDGLYWFNTNTWLDADDIRHWTIKDAKCGDVLARNNNVASICIFAHFDGINKEEESFLCYCGLEGEGLVQELSINGYHDDSDGYVPATKEQRDILFTKLREVGYEWDSYNKLLKKIVTYKDLNNVQSDKFDVSTLKPFDKVLVRDSKDDKWNPNIFSFYLSDNIDFRFSTITDSWRYCIPYNDDTKHLVGTTDDAPKFYKIWK